MSDIELSVVFRTGPITERDYDEAIEYLQEAKRLGTTGCPCGDSGHSAESCHHNPLLQARRGAAKDHEFRCFHCDQVFSKETAREHFGNDENGHAKCQSELDATLALLVQQAAASCVSKGLEPDMEKFFCDSIMTPLRKAYTQMSPAPEEELRKLVIGVIRGVHHYVAAGDEERILALVPDPTALAAHDDAALRNDLHELQIAYAEVRENAHKLEADMRKVLKKPAGEGS